MSRPALRGDERIINIHDEAKARAWLQNRSHWVGAIEGFLAGIGLAVFVGLVWAHRHGMLF